MIVREIEFKTPASKPAFIEYKTSGSSDWLPVPGTQPKNPPSFTVELEDGQYYDFRFRTFCGPDPEDLSPWTYIGPIFSLYPCQAPTNLRVTVPPPTDSVNDTIYFNWDDDKLLDGIPNLTVEIKLYNSAGVQVGPTLTGPYVYEVPIIDPRDPGYPGMRPQHQRVMTGVYRGLPPDTYTGILTVICLSGNRPTKSVSFKKEGKLCPKVTGVTYVETVNPDDSVPNNTFTFSWTNIVDASKGYKWEIYKGTRAGQSLVISGKTNVNITTITGISLPKGETYEFRVWAVCQYSEATDYAFFYFDSSLPVCSIGNIQYPDPTFVTFPISLTYGTVAATIKRVTSTTTSRRVSIYIKFYFRAEVFVPPTAQLTNVAIGTIEGLCRPTVRKDLPGTNGSTWRIDPNGNIFLSTGQYQNPPPGQMFTFILQTEFDL